MSRAASSSLFTRSVRAYIGLFVASVPAWWLFELINERTRNWIYLDDGSIGPIEHALLASLAFSTVIPAVFGTAELVGSFAWVRRHAASSDVSDRELEGSIATASLPIGPGRRGKIVIEIAGARESMTADPADESEIEPGAQVVVVGVENGVAIVAPLGPELELG